MIEFNFAKRQELYNLLTVEKTKVTVLLICPSFDFREYFLNVDFTFKADKEKEKGRFEGYVNRKSMIVIA